MPGKPLVAAPHGGCAHGHRPDVRGSTGTHAIALMADARGFRLCDCLMPSRKRRPEGRDDQVAGWRMMAVARRRHSWGVAYDAESGVGSWRLCRSPRGAGTLNKYKCIFDSAHKEVLAKIAR
jgi:hypothetical protein